MKKIVVLAAVVGALCVAGLLGIVQSKGSGSSRLGGVALDRE